MSIDFISFKAVSLPFRITTHDHSLAKMAIVWILPMVTLVVASSTGGLLANALRPNATNLATITTAVSFTSLIMGLSLALMIVTIYLTRLVLHGPPDAQFAPSAFMVLGPLGQGGFSLLINGQNLSELLPVHFGDNFPTALTGQVLFVSCFCGAWILWSMGVAWIVIALASIHAVRRKGTVPFSLGYWGVIFPNGVFALLSVQLGVVLDSPFFHYFGAISSSAFVVNT
jgi:tellurite resistance protein TehA-like permease